MDRTERLTALGEAVRTWEDRLLAAVADEGGDTAAITAALPGIPDSYKAVAPPERAVEDLKQVAGLSGPGDIGVRLYRGTAGADWRFTFYLAGEPATLTADMYGGSVVYHGTVVGLDAGTGSAFALLPAQNATGNWIKVVQRVPVRIALDPQELAEHPLRIGLSMNVEVDVGQDGDTSGQPAREALSTPVFDHGTAGADAMIAEILRSNLPAS